MSVTDTRSSDEPAGDALPPAASSTTTATAASSVNAPPVGRRVSWLGIAALLLAAGALLYWFAPAWRSGPTSSGPAAVHPAPGSSAAGAAPPAGVALSASQLERGVQRSREAVASSPEDAAAWAMLANTELMLGHYDEAHKAYERLLALRPGDAQVHAEAAEALGAAQGGSLAGEPQRLITRALELDAGNVKALVLAGKADFEQRRYLEAAQRWERALPSVQDPSVRRQLETSIAEARALAAPAAPGGAASASMGLAFVAGRVTVAESLKARLRPDDTLFVFARPAEGSRMPVALLKRRVADLPLDFALDDTLALAPQARLSQHKQVIVGARVSRRGDAIAASGDLQGQLGPVAVGSGGLRLEIDDVVK